MERRLQIFAKITPRFLSQVDIAEEVFFDVLG